MADAIMNAIAERAIVERDEARAEVESLRAIMATAVEELADPETRPGGEAYWRECVADAVEAMRVALNAR